jgi:hypothetical protein
MRPVLSPTSWAVARRFDLDGLSSSGGRAQPVPVAALKRNPLRLAAGGVSLAQG